MYICMCACILQKDHVRVAVKDALNRYTPAVPEEFYKVSCVYCCNPLHTVQYDIVQYVTLRTSTSS